MDEKNELQDQEVLSFFVYDLGELANGLREELLAQVSAVGVNLIIPKLVLSDTLVFGHLVAEDARPEIGQRPLQPGNLAFQHGS